MSVCILQCFGSSSQHLQASMTARSRTDSLEEQSSLQITPSSSGVRALPARTSSHSRSSSSSSIVRRGTHLKQSCSPIQDSGPGTGSLIPVNPQFLPRASTGMPSSRGVDVPMADGHPGSGAEETEDGPVSTEQSVSTKGQCWA